MDDLPSLDPELYQGLLFLKNYQGDVEQDLSLNFTISQQEFGQPKLIELIPNGAQISVTQENKLKYIYLTAHYKVNLQIRQQCEAFFSGLKDLMEPLWIRLFNQKELQLLLGGAYTAIDVKDLKLYTTYGGYNSEHPTILSFWKVLESFSEPEKQNFLKFVTSCPRPPLLGFKELKPSFCIRSGGSDSERLPTASTCINLLKLPEYPNEALLRE